MPNREKPYDFSPVRLLRFGRVKEAILKIEGGSDPNEVDESFYTPILYAVMLGSWQAFEVLATRGADLTWRGCRGETAFDFAVGGLVRPNWKRWSRRQIADCRKMIDSLDERGLLTPEQRALNAVARNKWKQVSELLDAGLSPDATVPDWHFEIALLSPEERVASLCRQARSQKNSAASHSSPTLLMWAAAMGRFAVCEALVRCGADDTRTDALGRTAKDYVSFYKHKYDGRRS